MIPVLAILALVGVGVGVGITFWDKIKVFLKEAYETAKSIVSVVSGIIRGVKSYIKKQLKNVFVILYEFYSQDRSGQWIRTLQKQKIENIDESEVPAEILAKVKKDENVDITEMLQDVLEG